MLALTSADAQKPDFTKPCTMIYVRYRTTNTGTLPSTRTSDV